MKKIKTSKKQSKKSFESKPSVINESKKPELIKAKHVSAEIVDTKKSKVQATKLPALQDGLDSYIAQIKKYPLLTKDQEMEIAKRYHESKDPKDAEILVTSNLRFVVKVAAEYAKFGSKLLDLIQEGNVGLMHAVKEFNPHKGVKLITYAVWWIRGYIQEYLMKQYSMVKIGTTQGQRKLFYRLEKEKQQIVREGKKPTKKLLSERLDVTEKEVSLMEARMGSKDLSLDQSLNGDGDTSFLELKPSLDTPADDQLALLENLSLLHENIESMKENLNDKEKLILEKRILSDEPLKLQEIGNLWGVSREAVRQSEARLIKKIKNIFLEKLQPENDKALNIGF